MVNLFELYYGAYKSGDVKRNLTAVKGLRSTLQVLSLTEGSSEQAGRILARLEAKGEPLEARDLFVGAIALEEGYAVLTANVDHFRRIPELQVVSENELSSSLFDLAGTSRLSKGQAVKSLDKMREEQRCRSRTPLP